MSWDRNAPLIASATRAILTITDGDRKEDTELDLGQLRNGSIVYSPITNDVSFRLEVTDVKNGKVGQESVRRLAGTGKPPAFPPGQPQTATKSTTAAPERPGPTPLRAAAVQPTPPPVERPTVTAEPAVTAKPAEPGSLATRIRAAEPIPEPPRIEGGSSAISSGQAPVQPTTIAPPPVTQRPAAPPVAAAAKPAPPPPQPAPSVRTGGQAQPARVIRRVPPTYPTIAIQGRVEGVVRVQVIVGKDGRVKKASAVSGPALLRRSAVDAVQRWVYSPAILNGEAVESEQPVDVNFKL